MIANIYLLVPSRRKRIQKKPKNISRSPSSHLPPPVSRNYRVRCRGCISPSPVRTGRQRVRRRSLPSRVSKKRATALTHRFSEDLFFSFSRVSHPFTKKMTKKKNRGREDMRGVSRLYNITLARFFPNNSSTHITRITHPRTRTPHTPSNDNDNRHWTHRRFGLRRAGHRARQRKQRRLRRRGHLRRSMYVR